MRRQSWRVRTILQPKHARTVSTATALKPAPKTLGKWERPQLDSPELPLFRATSLNHAQSREPLASASSASRPTVDSRSSYEPKINKWTRPQSSSSNSPHRSILESLDVPRPGSYPRRSNEKRNGYQPRSDALLRQVPSFPTETNPQRNTAERGPWRSTSHRGDTLDREPAPHLTTAREASNSPRQVHSFQRPERVSKKVARTELQPVESERGSVSESRSKSPRSEYFDDFVPVSNGTGQQWSRRVQRGAYKDRGSVIARLSAGIDIEIPSHSRTHDDRMESARKARKKANKSNPINVDVAIPSIISVENLSRLLSARLETLQRCMRRNGMEEQSSHDYMLSADDASLLAMEFNRNPVIDNEAAFDVYSLPLHPDQASLPRRPPIVTIMGHVDHGKTTLLDTLRSSSVAKGEAGGITQHIGAFSVPVPSAMKSPDIPPSITFLDTPGHAAFSAMRARGAGVTDIIVLVVAADDGVMPQTKEVIDLIKTAKDRIGLVVAINKVDKPGADVEKVQNALWAEGVELECMGGDVPSVEVSGLTGHGLDELVETISLLAELQDIRSETDGPAHGYVLESKVVKGLGNTATVLLLRGKLAPSSHIVCGTTYAKVRHLKDSSGSTVKAAGPGSAVVVSGWKELPSAGDEVLQGKESDVKRAVDNRKRKASLESTLIDAEAINASRRQDREERERRALEASGKGDSEAIRLSIKETGPKELRLIIKGDVSGSIEALAAAVESIGNKDAITKVVSTGVGEITESDIMLARAAEGMIIAFSVNVSRIAEQSASQHKIPIYSSNVIYNVLDEVKEQIIKLLPPIKETRVSGEANVLQIFDIKGKAKSIIKVAGCRVSNGVVEKDKFVRVLRDGEVLHEGTLSTLRILKRDVTEVKKGLECGMNVTGFSDLRAGDFLQFYQEIERPGQL